MESITREKALEICKDYLEGKGVKPFEFQGGVVVDDLKDVGFIAYNAPREGWIIKYPRPHFEGICSGFAIVISKETGKIIFDGDACDEG